jgi:phosphomethylpyrimidine synthase
MERARKGGITKEMKIVAGGEGVSPEVVRRLVAEGKVVIPSNTRRDGVKPVGIGEGLSVKINANIGASPDASDMVGELKKLEHCVKYGADTFMDLSNSGDLDGMRKVLLKRSSMPMGTVPIYQAVKEAGRPEDLSADILLEAIERQARDGVDFMTVHAGIRREQLPLLKGRLAGVVSRGGCFLVRWMSHHKKENPLYTGFDELLEIAAKYDVTLSLGDGLRPGCIADATDRAQIAELKVIGGLVKRAWERDVQVMVEGPGHIPINEIKKNVELEKRYCNGAPFYVLGPIVTDSALGYDHISGAIGGALAGYYGADLLCYVTPKEHLGLPEGGDVKEGILAFKIAAHSANVARGLVKARERDDSISRARHSFDWKRQLELSFDAERVKKLRSGLPLDTKYCSMCGSKYCPVRLFRKVREEL